MNQSSLKCLHCSQPIPFLRQLRDKEFCSKDHRQNYRRDSARLVRESAALGEMEESWLVTSGDLSRKPAKGGLSVVPVLLIGGVVAVLLVVSPKGSGNAPAKPVSYAPSVGDLGAKVMGSLGKVAFRQEFKTADLSKWMSAVAGDHMSADGEGWITKAGALYPGKLRLWQPTTLLADYQLNFAAAIETKAVSWAYRAADSSNYYGTKLIVSQDGRSEVSRWAVVEGESMARVQLPIPMTLSSNKDYQIQVRVVGNRFTTLVDNQLVDTWTDGKLSKGGVGFFSDPGERAAVKWVAVDQQESGALGGIFKFGFYLPAMPRMVAFPVMPR